VICDEFGEKGSAMSDSQLPVKGGCCQTSKSEV